LVIILDISAFFHGTLHDPRTWIHGGFISGQPLSAISRNQTRPGSLPAILGERPDPLNFRVFRENEYNFSRRQFFVSV
jgi:hypothetical protein